MLYTYEDALKYLSCSYDDEKLTTEQKTLFIFLQKTLSRIILEAGDIGKKFIFNKSELDQEEMDIFKNIISLAKFHIKYPTIVGSNIVSNFYLHYCNNDNLKEIIMSFSEIRCSDEILKNYVTTFEDFVTFEKKRLQIISLQDTITSFLFNKDLIEQKQEIESIYEILGSVFINYTTKDNIIDKENLLENESEIILDEDSYRKTIQVILEKVKKKDKVKSGYNELDKNILRGGFESGRVYLFTAKPGHGKSLLLLNLCYNATKYVNKDGYVVYITLENDIIETMDRLIRIALSEHEVDSTIENEVFDKDFRNLDKSLILELTRVLQDKKLIIKYMPPGTTTTAIFAWLNTLSTLNNIKLIAIDYYSLLRSSKQTNELRLELGQIILDLKNLSRQFNIPIITAGQLNTTGYNKIPGMSNIDESRKPAQNADFVCGLFEPEKVNLPYDPNRYKLIGFNVDKNRNGPQGTFYLLQDRKYLRFIQPSTAINIETEELMKETASINEIDEELLNNILSNDDGLEPEILDNLIYNNTSNKEENNLNNIQELEDDLL